MSEVTGPLGRVVATENQHKNTGYHNARGADALTARKHGLITRALGDTVNFCPPMIITRAEIGEMYARARRALDETYAWLRAGRPASAA